MKPQLHIKVSGGLEGDFVVTEERGADEFVITREPRPSLTRSGSPPGTSSHESA